VTEPITVRELRAGERAWANDQYQAIQFALTPPCALALVAERGARRVGLGRLIGYAPGVVELGGIWTDPVARGSGVARAMVAELIAQHERAGAAAGPLWCIPFAHLAAFYGSFGFAPRPRPWPRAIADKVTECIAHQLPEVVVLAR
jgi:GNAT superfamily N-acetyltransferase